MVALAFTANGFYFLCRGYRQLKANQSCWVHLALAAGCFNAFFYTRMSAAYFIPFMALVFCVSLVDLPDRRQRIKISLFFLCLAVLFGLSWFFYSQLLTPMYSEIVTNFSRSLMGSFNPYKIPILTSLGFVFGAVVLLIWWWVKSPKRQTALQTVLGKPGVLAPVFIILVLAMHPVWRIIAADHANFTDYWKFSEDVPGWRMFFYSSIYRYIMYLSPLGFTLLIIGVFLKKMRDNNLVVLAVVFTGFMMAACILQPNSAYAFYYDRYYLSEVVPSSLMLIAIIIAPASPAIIISTASRWIRWGAVAIMAAYFAFFSACQVGKTEGSYPDFFYELNKAVGTNDLLLCKPYNPDLAYDDKGGRRRPIKGSLVAYFNLKVFPVPAESDLARPEIKELYQKFNNVYYLSYDKCHDPDYKLVQTLQYREGYFIAGSHAWMDSSVKIMRNPYDYLLPFKHYEFSIPVYLYRLVHRL
jgi:hypothetical protein